ncbi:hypothetical protein PDR5_52760 [Pseudomonas sp. DR 5-09]|nr:hypothetical protein PDR5_52760 [Pseudomonas sp. DR 5-09]
MFCLRQDSAAGEVHGDFEADAQVGVSRFGPGHRVTPFSGGWDSAIHRYSPRQRRDVPNS